MKPTFRRDFETVEEFRERVAREAADRATFEPDIAKVLETPPPAAVSDLVSDTSETRDGKTYRTRVYASGAKITSIYFADDWTPPAGGDFLRPGNAGARAAFRAGREEEYIDRMRTRHGGEW
jgi:hypothetical protein